jgi:hypothetical protein
MDHELKLNFSKHHGNLCNEGSNYFGELRTICDVWWTHGTNRVSSLEQPVMYVCPSLAVDTKYFHQSSLFG